jgi:hypothetical protein
MKRTHPLDLVSQSYLLPMVFIRIYGNYPSSERRAFRADCDLSFEMRFSQFD